MSSDLRDLVGQDLPVGNDNDKAGYAPPVSQDEIDELLYSEQWPIAERVERLKAMRSELAELEANDFGEDDPRDLIRQIDAAVASLEGVDEDGLDPVAIDLDPSAHRETLSPDSDELEALEEDDEASLTDDTDDGPIDEREWIDGDGFDPDKGVR